MFLLLQGAEVLAPNPMGQRDILMGGGKILAVGRSLELPPGTEGHILDAKGLLAVPGFIDGHVHLIGGGGEGGFGTRTPSLSFSDAVKGGVTTLVGTLGTDGITRTMTHLFATAKDLEADGLSTFIFTGSYGVPVQGTLTGSVERDLLLIDSVIGCGEIALVDHRSSQPTLSEITRLAAETRRGAMLAGKAGIVNIHMGSGPRGLGDLFRILDETELPPSQFLPTHLGRSRKLFMEAVAWAKLGGFVDLTTSVIPNEASDEVRACRGLREWLDLGVNPDSITFSSDAQGSLPRFDEQGRYLGLGIGRVSSLFREVRRAVQAEGVPLATALAVITSNPARILGLRHKGQIQASMDADVVLLDPEGLQIHSVIAGGRILMEKGKILVRGRFEEAGIED